MWIYIATGHFNLLVDEISKLIVTVVDNAFIHTSENIENYMKKVSMENGRNYGIIFGWLFNTIGDNETTCVEKSVEPNEA